MMRFVYPMLGWVIPIVLAPLIYLVGREVLNVHRRVDDLPPFAKRIAVALIGTVIVGAFNVIGVAVPVECYLADTFAFTEQCATALSGPTVVRGITAAVVAMFIHALKKAKPNA